MSLTMALITTIAAIGTPDLKDLRPLYLLSRLLCADCSTVKATSVSLSGLLTSCTTGLHKFSEYVEAIVPAKLLDPA